MYYRIGLDIGIASVGWAVIETDDKGEPKRIVALGSRVFDIAEVPKTGASLAEPRRQARGLRRRLRRRAYRLECAKQLFIDKGIDFFQAPNNDINELRVRALDNIVAEQDFARILLLLIKRRGFKSNRQGERTKEEGLLLKATAENSLKMQEKGYRTIGEMFAKEYGKVVNGQLRYETRNKGGEYTRTVLRADIEKEINVLFDAQAKFGNKLATDEIRLEILRLFNMQRNFDEGPGKNSPYSATYKIGRCQFEQNEERAPKASYSFERSMALQKLNNLRIVDSNGSRELSKDERTIILEMIDKKKVVTFGGVRKALRLSEFEKFNALTYSTKKRCEDIVKECEKATFVSTEKSKSIVDCLAENNKKNTDIVDEIAYILSHKKTEIKRRELLNANPLLRGTLSEEETTKIIQLNFDKFGNLSIKAIKRILPYLEEGYKYSDACAKAGYNHSATVCERVKLLNTKEIYDELTEITSPVVKRSISQTLKVINAIINKYGSPLAVNVELAREMSKNREERKTIEKEHKERYENNQRLQNLILDIFNYYAKGKDILIYKLYEEQCGKCMYSGNTIDIKRIFEPNYVQVDHIIPYSRCFNDSYNNKVLVLAKENQDKGNRTPFEYLASTDRWNDYFDRVCATYANNYAKKRMLLTETINETEWKERALNDTRYISRFIYSLLNDRLLFEEGACGKKRVIAVNGAITGNLRHQWGVAKVREDGDIHHAIDAAIIACVTTGAINKLSSAAAKKETMTDKKDIQIVEPYEGFANELRVRCMEDRAELVDKLPRFNYTAEQISDVKPIFVSRMPRRKGKGAIHSETIKSAKYKDEGVVVQKVPLTKLKLAKDINGYYIADYFHPHDDKVTYELLLNKLIAADGNAEKAFADKVYKPCQEGKTPNEIKKVKVIEKYNSGVFLNKINGFADNANGAMIRIDVFTKDKKYYCVPVYTSDLYSGVMPNLAPIAGKKKSEWQLIDDSFAFQYALYPNDLIFIKHKAGIKMGKIRENANSQMPDYLEFKEGFVYYKGFNISSGSAVVINHNGCYSANIGLKTLESIEKYTVDVLGNTAAVKGEIRPPLKMLTEKEKTEKRSKKK